MSDQAVGDDVCGGARGAESSEHLSSVRWRSTGLKEHGSLHRGRFPAVATAVGSVVIASAATVVILSLLRSAVKSASNDPAGGSNGWAARVLSRHV